MSGTGEAAPTSAPINGPLWSARADDWAAVAAGMTAPAWQIVAELAGVGPGTQVLDLACGSGEFCRLAAGRGALVSGIDAAEGMIEIALERLPDGDFRVGAIENLPWEDNRFDVVTAFNALQFAADFDGTLAEAARVARPGGRIAICDWSRRGISDLHVVIGALRGLQPPPPLGAPPPAEPACEPDTLEEAARRAGLEPVRADEVDVPFEPPDQASFERAMLAPGPMLRAIEHSGEGTVRRAILAAAEQFRQPDGSYRLENRFRYLIAVVPADGAADSTA
jgi:SAM-dependent methyltransferase